MRHADDRDRKPVLTCAFCGKSQYDVSDLAGGPAVFVQEFVCDECVGSELAKLENPTPVCSQSLDQSLRRAVALAGRIHEGATSEHLLLALTYDPDAAPVMRACNVDLEKLRVAVLAAMSAPEAGRLPDGTVPRRPSQSFQEDLQRALAHARSIGREEINGADVLVALLAGQAAGFLQEQGMTCYDAMTFISHGIPTGPQARPRRADEIVAEPGCEILSGDSTGSSMFEVQLLNDDYTPMEFVVYLLNEVFELEHEDAVRVMLQTHHEGMGACGTFPREVAEAKAAKVLDLARQHQHPLRCRCLEQSGSL